MYVRSSERAAATAHRVSRRTSPSRPPDTGQASTALCRLTGLQIKPHHTRLKPGADVIREQYGANVPITRVAVTAQHSRVCWLWCHTPPLPLYPVHTYTPIDRQASQGGGGGGRGTIVESH